MRPSCSTMPPISCTSKWRWPRVRLAASRTVAKAGTSRSSRLLPAANSSRNICGPGAQRLVGKGGEFGLQGIDLGHAAAVLRDLAVIARAENLCGNAAQSQHLIRILQEGASAPRVEALSSQVAVPGQSAAAINLGRAARWGQDRAISMCCFRATGGSNLCDAHLQRHWQQDQCAARFSAARRVGPGLILAFFEGQRAALGSQAGRPLALKRWT